MTNIYAGIEQTCQQSPIFLQRRASNERHFIIENGEDLLRLCAWVRQERYYLCTMVVSDERLLEDDGFKIYYVFSSPDGYLIILEHLLQDVSRQYASISQYFPAVIPLEQEAYDLFGVSPSNAEFENTGGFVLHQDFPANLYPLRRTRSLPSLMERQEKGNPKAAPSSPNLPEGVFILPVGPIHAGIIEAGHFPFHVAGEIIEKLPIRLGYKHKGIEKLFETKYTLSNAWKLAQSVSGDSSFAHSMAYCQAVETLAGIEPPEPALYWRTLFLELERLYNHINDVGALAHDMAFDLTASPISALVEGFVQLNQRLSGHRRLRNINRPGGVVLSPTPNLEDARDTVRTLTNCFFDYAQFILEHPPCRERALTTGVLTKQEAETWGATGLVRRASGWVEHDFRLQHPQSVVYQQPAIRKLIEATISEDDSQTARRIPIFKNDLKGDVFARLALRIAEAETSLGIIQEVIEKLKDFDPKLPLQRAIDEALAATHNYEFGLGYVEGWRGDIFYWVMKGPSNTIFRCKVRGPSHFSWPAMSAAVIRKPKEENKNEYWENILADFPLINKSFNLSYAEHDL